ncbi:MAG TPA: DUF3313 family protein [Woeseiaceae bacterium]|nr:DUF3313 family protein [Woeseiaceae bacterium]
MIPSNHGIAARVQALVIASLVLSGCSTVETQSFTKGTGDNVESAQIAVDADFSRYDRLQAEEMGIYFPAGVAMRVGDLQRLRQSFRDAFIAELEGYSITREPGPSTMKVQASLIDLRSSGSADVASLRRDIREMATAGSLVFLMEMKDSQTDRVLARAADSAKAPALGTSEYSETDWQAVDEAARHWAKLFRQFLDQNLRR